MKNMVTRILFVLLFLVYPLMMTNGYYNVVATKVAFFGAVSLTAFFVCGWWKYCEYVERNKGISPKLFKECWKSFTGIDWWMTGLLVANILAFAFSKYRAISFSGATDGRIGLFFMILLLMIYIVFRSFMEYSEHVMRWLIGMLVIGADLSILFALVQFMGADPFHLFANLNASEPGNYLSTFGNIGVFGQYLTLVLPVIGYCFCITKKLQYRIFLGVSSILGVMGVLISNTDATYLGFAAMLLMMLIVLLNRRSTAKRFQILLFCYTAGILVFRVIYSLCDHARSLSVFAKLLVNGSWSVLLVLMGVIFGIWALFQFVFKSEDGIFYHMISWVMRVLVVVIMIGGIATVVFFSIINREARFYGVEQYLRFSDSWGTDRGYVWRWLVTIFGEAGLVQKLFGAGQGSVVLELFAHYKYEMAIDLEYFFDNAHNVYLHLLTTTGILGCVAYVGVIVKTIGKMKEKNGYVVTGLIIAVVAYAVQDVVSILQPITWSLLFVYIGIIAGINRSK